MLYIIVSELSQEHLEVEIGPVRSISLVSSISLMRFNSLFDIITLACAVFGRTFYLFIALPTKVICVLGRRSMSLTKGKARALLFDLRIGAVWFLITLSY